MQLRHLELFVSDPLAARDFYVHVLGFELEMEQGPAGEPPKFIWLNNGPHSILLRPGSPPAAAASYQQAACGIVLCCADLEKQAAELRARGLEFKGDDGPGCPTFTDPDGHWFQLIDHGLAKRP